MYTCAYVYECRNRKIKKEKRERKNEREADRDRDNFFCGTHQHIVQRCIQDEEPSRDTNCNMQAANPEDFVTRGGPRIGCPSGNLSLQQSLGELDAKI